jgi:hypothetical protein
MSVSTHSCANSTVDIPVLLESVSAQNRRSIRPRLRQNLVRGAIDVDGSLLRGSGRRVVRPVVLDNVVFDQRAGRPAVDGKVRVAVGREGARVLDRSTHSSKSVGQSYRILVP